MEMDRYDGCADGSSNSLRTFQVLVLSVRVLQILVDLLRFSSFE